MKILILLISLLFTFCLVDPSDEDMENAQTFSFISGTYLQHDVHPWGNDTAWWTFFVEDGYCSVYCAIKIKAVNTEGYMPVKHDRGSFVMTDDTSSRMLLSRNVTVSYPPRGYNTNEETLFMDEFRVRFWDSDSFYMKSKCYNGVIFEGAEWNGLSLLDEDHQAYIQSDMIQGSFQ